MDYQLAATGRIPIDTHLAGGWQKVSIMQLDWLAHQVSREHAKQAKETDSTHSTHSTRGDEGSTPLTDDDDSSTLARLSRSTCCRSTVHVTRLLLSIEGRNIRATSRFISLASIVVVSSKSTCRSRLHVCMYRYEDHEKIPGRFLREYRSESNRRCKRGHK